MIKSLYIHIPFCEKKCAYCDFLSYSSQNQEIKSSYIEALEKEFRFWQEKEELQLETVFLGGGTPSALDKKSFKKLCDFLSSLKEYPIQEMTMEANPGTLDDYKVKLLSEAGVNRISLGVQSFQDKFLKKLGRIHSEEDVYQAYNLLRKNGLKNINLDLMYGLPFEDLADWEKSLDKALDLRPEHLSLYQLRIEEGTLFGRFLEEGQIGVFDDELALQMYQLAREKTEKAGLHQYEISNYAQKNRQSLHNLAYWKNQSYLGIGLGAHSSLAPYRRANVGKLEDYIKNLMANRLADFEEEFIDEKTAMSETAFMALRLKEGVNFLEFEKRFQKDFQEVFKEAIHKCEKLDLIEKNEDFLALNTKGLYLGNLVFEEFLL